MSSSSRFWRVRSFNSRLNLKARQQIKTPGGVAIVRGTRNAGYLVVASAIPVTLSGKRMAALGAASVSLTESLHEYPQI